jgi:hypothetical protein
VIRSYSNFVNHLNPNGPGRASPPFLSFPLLLTHLSHTVTRWPQYSMDRLTLQLARANTTVVTDSFRLDAMRFLNINNPIFAR